MADDDERRGGDETYPEAHRRGDNRPGGDQVEPDPERAAKVGDSRAVSEAALDDLARQMAGGEAEDDGDQLDLLHDESLPLFAGPVRHVAKTLEAARGRGRPTGSKNKANQLFRDTLMKMGYRHPGLNLAALANADPIRLAAELSAPYRPKKGPHAGELVEASCTPFDAMELIRKANAELLPYFESKRPTEVKVDSRQLGVFIMAGAEDGKRDDDERFVDVEAIPPDQAKTKG